MSTTQTGPARPARRPADRAPKGGRSPYAQHVAAVEETLREEYADGTKRVTLASDDGEAEKTVNAARKGGYLIAGVLAVCGLAAIGLNASLGVVNAGSYIGVAFLALAFVTALITMRPKALEAAVAHSSGNEVHTLTATSIEALREAPGALREADAPDNVVVATETLLAKGEERLEAIVNHGDPLAADSPEVAALVRLAAKSLALVAIHDQAPDAAPKAAAEALAAPQRTQQRKRR